MKTLLTILTAVVLSATAIGQDKLIEYSLLQTNWRTVTNFVEVHTAWGGSSETIFLPRDMFLFGTVFSNRFDSILHDGKRISTTLVDSKIVANIQVTFTTNIVAHTNMTTSK